MYSLLVTSIQRFSGANGVLITVLQPKSVYIYPLNRSYSYLIQEIVSVPPINISLYYESFTLVIHIR